MWMAIFFAVLAAMVTGIIYVIRRVGKCTYIKKLTKEKKRLQVLWGSVFIVILLLILGFTMGSVNAVICVIHLVLFMLLCDFAAFLVKKCRKKETRFDYAIIAAFGITVVYLAVAWYLAHHVWRTDYTIETKKEVGKFRIVQFADSHIGTTFHAKGFKRHMEEIEKENPDVVVITGDYVDDDTSKEDMIACCKALGELETTYGVYYSFGNHDKGYFRGREYDGDDLIRELEKNNVIVLQDESVLVDDRVYIVGRQDRSEEQRGESRVSMEELVKLLDKDKYIVVLDHQPNDYAAQAKAGVDLVLSGHTHGGQFFPVTYVGEWIGANDKTYGYEKRDKTDFIVTSGISDWAIKFKTGCKSEYVVIDVEE